MDKREELQNLMTQLKKNRQEQEIIKEKMEYLEMQEEVQKYIKLNQAKINMDMVIDKQIDELYWLKMECCDHVMVILQDNGRTTNIFECVKCGLTTKYADYNYLKNPVFDRMNKTYLEQARAGLTRDALLSITIAFDLGYAQELYKRAVRLTGNEDVDCVKKMMLSIRGEDMKNSKTLSRSMEEWNK